MGTYPSINYTPIFGVADRLVRVLQGDDELVGDVLRILRKTAPHFTKDGTRSRARTRGYRLSRIHYRTENH